MVRTEKDFIRILQNFEKEIKGQDNHEYPNENRLLL